VPTAAATATTVLAFGAAKVVVGVAATLVFGAEGAATTTVLLPFATVTALATTGLVLVTLLFCAVCTGTDMGLTPGLMYAIIYQNLVKHPVASPMRF
jgi:hypothetical protein